MLQSGQNGEACIGPAGAKSAFPSAEPAPSRAARSPALVVRCLGLALVSTMVAAPHTATAQNAAIEGTFACNSNVAGQVATAIEASTAELSSLHRRFARDHLLRTVAPFRTVTIEQDATSVSITTDGGRPISAPVSGQPVEWTRNDGTRMRVSIAREHNSIRQTFVAGDEQREHLFRWSAGSRGITATVTLRVDRLPKPIRYEVECERQR
jgi:predicted secreted protein